jgi:hypothetical protein
MGMKVHTELTEQIVILSAASRAFCYRESCPHDFLLPAKVTNRMSFRRVNKVQREVEESLFISREPPQSPH